METIVFGVLVPAFLVFGFAHFARGVWAARRFAAAEADCIVRVLGACRSREFGLRIGLPVVVVEIGPEASRFVTFAGRSSREDIVPTDQLKLRWWGASLACVEHPESGTRLWPRWNPTLPGDHLTPGQASVS